MSGLYRRAVEYLKSQSHLRLVKPDEKDEFIGSAEEQAQIEREIQRAIDENRIPVGPDTFSVTPQKRGPGLPLLVNLCALLIIAAGVVLLLRLFSVQEAEIAAETATVRSAEGRLLTALREESAAQLSEKEAEIAEIERQLASVARERAQIRESAESRLAEQEAALRAEFNAELEAERARLAGITIPESEREARLAQFRRALELELETELAGIREASDGDVAAQEAAIEAALSEYQESLNVAEQERQTLRASLAERETELEAQFAEREAALSSERETAVELLAELEQQQRQVSLIQDQILSFYTQIRSQLTAGSLEQAEQSLAELRAYLEGDTVAAVPELQRRRQIDLFLVSTLEERLRRTRSARSVDAQGLVESARLIEQVNALTAQAETAFADGSREQARELYVAALSQIPAVQTGYERLTQIETELAARDSGAPLRALQEELAATDTVITRLEARLSERSSEQESLGEELDTLRSRVAEQRELVRQINLYRESFRSERPETGTPDNELELLESKLLILRIVGSETVRADYPDLGAQLNEYLDALVREQRAAATRETLAELDALLATLATETSRTVAQIENLSQQYPALAAVTGPTTESFFRRLERLVEPEQQ